MNKICRICGEMKPIEKFPISKTCKDGHLHFCCSCKSKKRGYKPTWSGARSYYQLKRYGITENKFNQLATNQNGVCAICGKTCNFCVDHCHSTGKVRGLLCYKCNSGIGFLDDNPILLQKAIKYLETNSTFPQPVGTTNI